VTRLSFGAWAGLGLPGGGGLRGGPGGDDGGYGAFGDDPAVGVGGAYPGDVAGGGVVELLDNHGQRLFAVTAVNDEFAGG
jgi:hypothetical protein